MPIQSCGQSVSARRGERYTVIGLLRVMCTIPPRAVVRPRPPHRLQLPFPSGERACILRPRASVRLRPRQPFSGSDEVHELKRHPRALPRCSGATFEKASSHFMLSAETRRAFNSVFDTVHLHRPTPRTAGVRSLPPPPPPPPPARGAPLARARRGPQGLAAQVEIVINVGGSSSRFRFKR
jgi:hypothetical protein